MKFRIADMFSESLAKLNRDEQQSINITSFDLQLNPANPGTQFHKLDKSNNKNFSSVRRGNVGSCSRRGIMLSTPHPRREAATSSTMPRRSYCGATSTVARRRDRSGTRLRMSSKSAE